METGGGRGRAIPVQKRIYWPYLLGSILPGLVTSGLFAWATIPLVTAYQSLRTRRLQEQGGDEAAARRPSILTLLQLWQWPTGL